MRVLALAFVLVLAACSHKPKPSSLVPAEGALDDLRAAVAREIKDPERAKRAAALVEELEQLAIAAHADFKAHAAALRTLNANYDSYHAQAGDIQKLLQQQRAEIASYQEEMIRCRFELKGKMSREEWAKVFPAARESSRP